MPNNTTYAAYKPSPVSFPCNVVDDVDTTKQHVALITHLVRVPSLDSGAQYGFCFTVTPCLATTDPTKKIVTLDDTELPDGWEATDVLGNLQGTLGVAVATYSGTPAQWALVDTKKVNILPVSQPAGGNDPDLITLTQAVNTDLGALIAWIATRIDQEKSNPLHVARDTLSQIGNSVSPYNYLLNLALCFTAEVPPDASVSALPVYDGAPLPVLATAAPTQNVVAWDAQTLIKDLKVVVYAYTVPVVQAANPDPNWAFDPKQQRIAVSDACEGLNEGSDWLRKLPARCGTLFDLPQRILDHARAAVVSASANNGSTGNIDPLPLWTWILATSRDLAGTGWTRPLLPLPAPPTPPPLPASQTLLVTLTLTTASQQSGNAAFQDPPVAYDLNKALHDFEQTKFNTLELWLDYLSSTIKTDDLISSDPTQNWPADLTLDECVRRWSRFITDIRAPANFRKLVKRQWTDALANWDGDAHKLTPSDALISALSTVLNLCDNPVIFLADELLDNYLPDILDESTTDKDAKPYETIATKARNTFAKYCSDRADDAMVNTLGLWPRVCWKNGGVIPIPDITDTFTQDFVNTVLFPNADFTRAATPGTSDGASNAAPPVLAQQTPNPMVLKVGQIGKKPAPSSNVLRDFAGVILFLEQSPLQPGNQQPVQSIARCPNLGYLALPNFDGPTPQAGALPQGDTVLKSILCVAPRRLGYLDGTSTAHFTYNNSSLVARSPGGRIYSNAIQNAQDKKSRPPLPSYYYEMPAQSDQDRPSVKLPSLAYGRQYNAAAFVVLNGGILPKAIASSKHPALLNGYNNGFAKGFDPGVFDSSPPIPYLRTVGVGAPAMHLGDKKAELDWVNALKVDSNTRSLAAELLAHPAANANSSNSTPGNGSAPTPLVLLYPDDNDKKLQSSVTFQLVKAATDFENWDRWALGFGLPGVSADQLPAQRLEVRAATTRQRDTNGQAQPAATSVELDDPALEDKICLLAQRIFPDGPAATPNFILFDISAASSPIRRTAVAVTISAGSHITDGDIQITLPQQQQPPKPPGSPVTITVPVGSVWNLKFYSVISTDNVKRFTSGNPKPLLDIDGSPNLKAISPLELNIEAATSAMPKSASLRSSLNPDCTGRRPSLVLNRDEKNDPNWPFISRVETDLQAWTWSGRPLMTAFPFGNLSQNQAQAHPDFVANIDLPDFQNWDAEGFAHRQDSECRTEETRVFWDVDNDLVTLRTENHDADQRAYYLRWSARIYSRYPLLNSDPVSLAVFDPDPATKKPAYVDPWKRCFLAGNIDGKLSKPSLRLILPLGNRISPDPSNPTKPRVAVLAVFNDAWYSEAGLPETLGIQCLTVNTPEANPTTYLQAGFDPIVSTAQLDNLNDGTAFKIAVLGPMAHTFDSNALNPLVVASSFNILLPDTITLADGKTVTSADWFMARLSFSRSLDPGYLKWRPGSAANASDWTPAEWVQFAPAPGDLLPDAWLDPAGQNPPSVTITEKQPGTGAYQVSNWPEVYADTPIDTTRFDYWLVVTRLARDIAGQELEVYAATLGRRTDDDTTWSLIDSMHGSPLTATGLVLRVVELRIRNRSDFRSNVNQSPWSLLFGDLAGKRPVAGAVRNDADAQITRISPPVSLTVISN